MLVFYHRAPGIVAVISCDKYISVPIYLGTISTDHVTATATGPNHGIHIQVIIRLAVRHASTVCILLCTF